MIKIQPNVTFAYVYVWVSLTMVIDISSLDNIKQIGFILFTVTQYNRKRRKCFSAAMAILLSVKGTLYVHNFGSLI